MHGWRWYLRTACLLFIIVYGALAILRLLSVLTFKNPLWLSAAMMVVCGWVLFDSFVLDRRTQRPHP